MPPECIPNILLFGLLPSRRPPGGPRKRWKDCISADLKALNAVEGWYDLADSRPDWRRMYHCFKPEPPTPNVHCQVCDRYFSCPSDEKHHKCLAERQKPVCNQAGACQCRLCQRWFRSPGGLATHRCDHGPAPNIEHPGNPVTPQCSTCHEVSCSVAAWTDTSATARNEGQCREGPTSRLSALAKGSSDYVTI